MTKLTDAQIAELIAKNLQLEREREALQAELDAKNKLTAKVAKGGGISVYGLQRMPITLYADQWRRFFGSDIQAQIETLAGLDKEAFAKLQAEAVVRSEENEAKRKAKEVKAA